MPQTQGAHAAGAAGERAVSWWCALNKVDAVDDPELLDLVELEVRELLTSVSASRATMTPVVRGRRSRRDARGDPAGVDEPG